MKLIYLYIKALKLSELKSMLGQSSLGPFVGMQPLLVTLRTPVVKFKGKSQLPVLIGSGVNIDNAKSLLSVCDGCIISSSLKRNGFWWEKLDEKKVKLFVDKLNE